jgi:hypothetical protein
MYLNILGVKYLMFIPSGTVTWDVFKSCRVGAWHRGLSGTVTWEYLN